MWWFYPQFRLEVGVIGVLILIVAVTYMIGAVLAGPLADKLVSTFWWWDQWINGT